MRAVLLCFLLLTGWSPTVFGQQPKAITNSIGMKLVLIHAGSFTMGSSLDEVGRLANETPHEVTFSRSYYLGVFEVTQEQYEKVIGERPSVFIGIQLLVNQISREDAVSFCKKLSDLPEEKAAGREYRLPTEAEWEYACRATSPTAYCFGDSAESLGEYAWFDQTMEGRRIQWARRSRTDGACMTCTGMFGSGARMGTLSIHRVRRPIQVVLVGARPSCSVAAVGATLRRVVDRHTASRSNRRSVRAASASA